MVRASVSAERRDEWSRVLNEEAEVGRRLISAGTISRIWRIPGRQANVAIYDVASVEELHETLMSLPLAPWATFDVTALAQHPLERDRANS